MTARHFGLTSNRPSVGETTRPALTHADTLRGASNIIPLPVRARSAASHPTSGLTRRFFSSLRQFAIDALSLFMFALLTVVTAGGIMASIFILLFCRT